MTDYIFKKFAEKGKLEGVDKMKPQQARKWFRDMAQTVTRADPRKVIGEAGPFEAVKNLSVNSIGKMYLFTYDAKWKDKLPYWDMFPLIFPIEFYPEHKNGPAMLGINLHYLYPYQRAKLMNALYETINNDKYNKTTKLKISYQILKGASQFALFKPCIKMYLMSQLRSNFLYIKPQMWDFAMMLPLARFQKANQNRVWMESSMMANDSPNFKKKKRKKRTKV